MSSTYSRNFWLLSFSSYLFFSSFNMLIAELPAYLSRLGGKEYLGLIIFLFTVTAGLSRPFSGHLTDKWGRIPVMVVGAVVSGVAALFYPILSTVTGFLLLRLFHGFSTGFKPTGTSAYIADIVPANKRGEALGISSFFGSVGMASAPALGSWIYLHFGLNTLFYTSSLFAFGSVAILIGLKETLPNKQRLNYSMLKLDWSNLLDLSVISPALVMLLCTFSFGTIITLAPDFSDYLGIQNRGTFYLIFTGSSLLVRITGGRLSDKYGRVTILKYSTSILFLSMMVMGFAQSQSTFFAGAILFGMGYGLNSPSLFAWTIDISNDQSRGKALATLYIALEVGIGMGALLSGFIYMGETSRFPFIFTAAGLLSFFAFIFLSSKPKK